MLLEKFCCSSSTRGGSSRVEILYYTLNLRLSLKQRSVESKETCYTPVCRVVFVQNHYGHAVENI